MADVPLPVTGDEEADRFLAKEPLALRIGMLLDQQARLPLRPIRTPAALC